MAAKQPFETVRTGTVGFKNVIVDVGSETVVPTIVRRGKEITPPSFNTARIDDFLSHSTTVPRPQIPVAVSQSIPAGTMVPKGTPVDLVFVPTSSIKFELLDNVHDDLKALAITDALPVIGDPTVIPILQKSSTDLTADERALVVNKLKTINVTVDDTNPAKTFDLAFSSLKAAEAFA